MNSEEKTRANSCAYFMHTIPRFGHGSDLSKMFSSEQSEQLDYVMGLWAVSFLIISLYILWISIAVALRLMGQTRVGFLSGRVQVISDEKGRFYIPSYLWKLRCSFILMGFLMILSNIALTSPCMRLIQYTSISTRKLTRDVNDLLTQGLLVVDSVSNVKNNLETLDFRTITQIEHVCPNLKNNTFFKGGDLQLLSEMLKKEFISLKKYVGGSDFEIIEQNIFLIMDANYYVDNAITQVERNDWIIKMYALILNVLVFFMISLAAASLSGRYLAALKFITIYFIFPLFVILIAGSWIAASFLSFIGISNADFCTGHPEKSGAEGTIHGIFKELGISTENVVHQAFTYYETRCATDDPIKNLYKYEDNIQSAIELSQKILTYSEETGIEVMSTQCGASIRPIIEEMGLVNDNLGILLNALRSTFDLASCSKITPIFKRAFHGAVCTDSVRGLTIAFSLAMTIGIIGMIMITLRAAMYPCRLLYATSNVCSPDEEEDEWEEYQAYLRYVSDFLSIWGRQEIIDAKPPIMVKDDSDTKSESSKTKSSTDTFQHSLDHHFSTDERGVISLPSHEAPAFSYCSPRKNEENVNEEMIPLSPQTQANAVVNQRTSHQSQYTPSLQGDLGIANECQAFTPLSSSIHFQPWRTRLQTPDFLRPGTFHRWRCHEDIDDKTNNTENEVPESPLMKSPKKYGGVSCLSPLNVSHFISPLSRRVLSPVNDSSVKNKFH